MKWARSGDPRAHGKTHRGEQETEAAPASTSDADSCEISG